MCVGALQSITTGGKEEPTAALINAVLDTSKSGWENSLIYCLQTTRKKKLFQILISYQKLFEFLYQSTEQFKLKEGNRATENLETGCFDNIDAAVIINSVVKAVLVQNCKLQFCTVWYLVLPCIHC